MTSLLSRLDFGLCNLFDISTMMGPEFIGKVLMEHTGSCLRLWQFWRMRCSSEDILELVKLKLNQVVVLTSHSHLTVFSRF